ncbi:MAG: hypothetical protein GDA51_14005 [Ekhidna sp.]|nr:hypothetical protein [Ekhidna sp.]
MRLSCRFFVLFLLLSVHHLVQGQFERRQFEVGVLYRVQERRMFSGPTVSKFFGGSAVRIVDGISLRINTDDEEEGRLGIFLAYTFAKKKGFDYVVSGYYYEQFQKMYLEQNNLSINAIYISLKTTQFFINGVWAPSSIIFFRRLNITFGIGPAFYRNFGEIPTSVPHGALPLRSSSDLKETYIKSHVIHRKFSLNYNVRLTWRATKRIGVFFQRQGNLTPVNKPVRITNGVIDTNARWYNHSFGLSYQFDLFKKSKEESQ